jgi:hypothetical protein
MPHRSVFVATGGIRDPVPSHLANQAPYLAASLVTGEGVTGEGAHGCGLHRLPVFQHTHLLQFVWNSKSLGSSRTQCTAVFEFLRIGAS